MDCPERIIRFVYVAGAYSANTPEERDANVARADEAGRCLAALGYCPLVPHNLTHRWEEDPRLCYDDFLRMGLAWIERCDAILYLGPSPGADRELLHARACRLVVWRSLEEVPETDTRKEL